jgi:hypothetical protein
VLPFFYIPVSVLGSQTRSIAAEDVARAMCLDAERFVSGADQQEMKGRIGWRGLKRLYYDDIMALKH